MAERVAITVRDVYYYLGHAQVAMSRLHVSMMTSVPRIVKTLPPRRTEMRRVIQSLSSMAPTTPSGYIIDIEGSDSDGRRGRATAASRATATVSRPTAASSRPMATTQATPSVAPQPGSQVTSKLSSQEQSEASVEARSEAVAEAKSEAVAEAKSETLVEPKTDASEEVVSKPAPRAEASGDSTKSKEDTEGEKGKEDDKDDDSEDEDLGGLGGLPFGLGLGLPLGPPPGASPFSLGPVTIEASFNADSGQMVIGPGSEEGGRTIAVDVTAVPGSEEHTVNIKDSATGHTETQTIPAPRSQVEGATGETGKGKEKEGASPGGKSKVRTECCF